MNFKRNIFVALVVIIVEIALYFTMRPIVEDQFDFHLLLTRYSARISFAIIIAMMFWVGVKGLPKIFANERSLSSLNMLIIALTINHLIHLLFVINNYLINDWSLIRVKSIFGFIGYVSIVIMPFYMRSKKVLNRNVNRNIYIYLFIITLICLVKYLGRVFDQKFLASPDNIIWFFIVLLSMTLMLNVYQIIISRKEIRKSLEH